MTYDLYYALQNEGAENKVVSAGWQIGDKCMARYWQDGQVIVTALVGVIAMNVFVRSLIKKRVFRCVVAAVQSYNSGSAGGG